MNNASNWYHLARSAPDRQAAVDKLLQKKMNSGILRDTRNFVDKYVNSGYTRGVQLVEMQRKPQLILVQYAMKNIILDPESRWLTK